MTTQEQIRVTADTRAIVAHDLHLAQAERNAREIDTCLVELAQLDAESDYLNTLLHSEFRAGAISRSARFAAEYRKQTARVH